MGDTNDNILGRPLRENEELFVEGADEFPKDVVPQKDAVLPEEEFEGEEVDEEDLNDLDNVDKD